MGGVQGGGVRPTAGRDLAGTPKTAQIHLGWLFKPNFGEIQKGPSSTFFQPAVDPGGVIFGSPTLPPPYNPTCHRTRLMSWTRSENRLVLFQTLQLATAIADRFHRLMCALKARCVNTARDAVFFSVGGETVAWSMISICLEFSLCSGIFNLKTSTHDPRLSGQI